MRLADQWTTVIEGLDPRWQRADVRLVPNDEHDLGRAAALLGPASPGRVGNALRFVVERGGGSVGPEAVPRLLHRLDDEGIGASLELLATAEAEAPAAPAAAEHSLATAWDAAAAELPADWSDLLCELALTSTDYVDHAALLLAPINPIQTSAAVGFRFRCARTFGYGASSGMVRRCLARLDEAGIPGRVQILRALSDTDPIGTQGPVWYVGGKAV